MHVTARLEGHPADVEVEVGEECRTTQALKEAIVVALPQLCVEGFDVSVGGRSLDDEGVVSLEASVCLDVSANTRGRSILELREAGREVSESGLLAAAKKGSVALCTLYLDAGVPLDCVDAGKMTPLHLACTGGYVELVTLLLDRGSTAYDDKDSAGETPFFIACWHDYLEIAELLLDRGCSIDEKDGSGDTPFSLACCFGALELVALLLDRGSDAIDEKDSDGDTPLLIACRNENVELATLLLDRGTAAIDVGDSDGDPPLIVSCRHGDVAMVTLLLDRGCSVVEEYRTRGPYSQEVLKLMSERGHDVLHDAECAKRRRIDQQ